MPVRRECTVCISLAARQSAALNRHALKGHNMIAQGNALGS